MKPVLTQVIRFLHDVRSAPLKCSVGRDCGRLPMFCSNLYPGIVGLGEMNLGFNSIEF